MSTPARPGRSTHRWFAVYTLVLFTVFGLSVWKHQWSVALTTLGIGLLLAFITRWLWRRR